MEITRIEAIPVSVRRKISLLISYVYESRKFSDYTIVKIHTDEGIIGLGEASTTSGPSTELVKPEIDKFLSPSLIGEDPFNIEFLLEKMRSSTPISKTAVEMALYDIMGKKLKVPIYKLVGGRYRDMIPVTWVIGIKSAREMAKEAKDYVDKGFNTIKIKVGRDPRKDVERLKAVREACGEDAKIRADANGGYETKIAIKTIKEMEKYDLELMEDPIPPWDIRGQAEVVKAVDIPIMADGSIQTPRDAINLIREEAADIFNIYIMSGGILNAIKIATIAEAADIPCMLGSNLELGIGTSAGAQVAAATRNIKYASDIIGPLYYESDVITQPLKIDKGLLEVPKGPGLGVDLDERIMKDVMRD